MMDKSSKVFLTEEPDLFRLKLKKVLRSTNENNDLTKVFKEDDGLEKTGNKEKLDDKKILNKMTIILKKIQPKNQKLINKENDQSDKKLKIL